MSDLTVWTDQSPRSAASDLGLHCLPTSLLWGTRIKWVKILSKHVVNRPVMYSYVK